MARMSVGWAKKVMGKEQKRWGAPPSGGACRKEASDEGTLGN